MVWMLFSRYCTTLGIKGLWETEVSFSELRRLIKKEHKAVMERMLHLVELRES